MDTFDKLATFPEARQLGLQRFNYLSLLCLTFYRLY